MTARQATGPGASRLAGHVREMEPNRDGHQEGLRPNPPADLADRVANLAADIRRFVAQRVCNQDDAADIAQQTLFQAFAGLGTYRNGDLRSWLFAIARHLITDHHRAARRFQWIDAAQPSLAELEPALRTARDLVPDACEHRALFHCYVECIAGRLRKPQGLAVLLADICGYRDKESAAALGMTLPGFKFLLHTARRDLRQAVGRDCPLVSRQGPVACARCARSAQRPHKLARTAGPAHWTETPEDPLLRFLSATMSEPAPRCPGSHSPRNTSSP